MALPSPEHQTRGGCPFLNPGPDHDGGACLARPGDPEPVTQAYVEGVCLTPRHFACPRFEQVDPALKTFAEQFQRDRWQAHPGDSSGLPTEARPSPPVVEREPVARTDGPGALVTSSREPLERESSPTSVDASERNDVARPPEDQQLHRGDHHDPDSEPSDVARPPEVSTERSTIRRGRWSKLTVILVLAAILVAATTILLISGYPRPQSTVARPTVVAHPLAAPGGLVARQIGADLTTFDWKGVSGATGYFVNVNGSVYPSSVPHFVSATPFQPGTRLLWAVQARNGNQVGQTSPTAALVVRPLPSPVWSFPSVDAPGASALLTLYNSTSFPCIAIVHQVDTLDGATTRVRIRAHASAEVGLRATNHRSRTLGLLVTSNQPVVAQRVVVQGRSVQSAYGIPGRVATPQ